MNILSVTSEMFPLIKTGGLADVAGALPPALAAHGVHVRTLLPAYPSVMARLGKAKRRKVAVFDHLFGGKADLLAVRHGGLDLLLLDAPHLFDRDGGPYSDTAGNDHGDNWKRFAAFARAAAAVAQGAVAGYAPDLVHVHDWQAAMTPAYLKHSGKPCPPSVITVHNLAFQGQFAPSVFGELGLPPQAWSLDGVEYYGSVGFLKAGLQAADAITTVSPTYAQEIRSAEFGMGLEGLINGRSDVLHGIVNGIDTAVWNPETDEALVKGFSARSLKGRHANRRAVEQRFGLDEDNAPLFCVISRLTWQKGMDVLAGALDGLAAMGAKLAVLGSGDKGLEGLMLAAAARHKGRIGVVVGYDEPLSHLVQGGADAILVPSRFEPCGLTQLCGLRYGCIPVVTRTGGLADTVIDANHAALNAGVATGVQFAPLSHDALTAALARTIGLHGQPKVWTTMQKRAMAADVSWDASALRYADLFASLIHKGHS